MTDWPEGVDRQVIETTDSTNAEALRQAAMLTAPKWILTKRQTSGRGRRGRDWQDPEGNFAATLVMRPAGSAANVALRSFVAALALYETLIAVTGRVDGFAVKWPNDVLLHGGKLAGILLESQGQGGGGVNHLAIGIGVNLRQSPQQSTDSGYAPVNLLSETGISVTPEEFLDILAPAYAKLEHQFLNYGFGPIRTRWLDCAARLGEVITARTTNDEFVGTFETVDDDGALVLNCAQGRIVISAADVFFEGP